MRGRLEEKGDKALRRALRAEGSAAPREKGILKRRGNKKGGSEKKVACECGVETTGGGMGIRSVYGWDGRGRIGDEPACGQNHTLPRFSLLFPSFFSLFTPGKNF